MEQHERETRYKKKRLRKGRLLIFLLLVLFVLCGVYVVQQYNSGKEFAS